MNTTLETSPELERKETKAAILFRETLMDIQRINGHKFEWVENSTLTFETQDDMIKVSEVSDHAVKSMSIRKKGEEYYYRSSRWDIADSWTFESQKEIIHYLNSINEQYAKLRRFQVMRQLKQNNHSQMEQEKEADLFLQEELEKTNTF